MGRFGLVNLDKPRGLTSRQAVDYVKRLVRPAKVGHAGTLDPLATGVLVICIGPATRLAEYVQRMPKRYRGTFLLGRRSDSDDTELPVSELSNPPRPSLTQVRAASEKLVGQIEQRPPAYSAIKVQGRRSYALARRGTLVALPPRPVVVYRFDVRRYEYPEIELEIECGAGTYIRSLGRDLAESLGTAAVMAELTRTAVGPLTLATAERPAQLHRGNIDARIVPPIQAVAELPRMELSDADLAVIRNGGEIVAGPCEGAAEVVAVDREGHLVAILTEARQGGLRPLRNFA
jgi:tRNA pseudouridine55 synthase